MKKDGAQNYLHHIIIVVFLRWLSVIVHSTPTTTDNVKKVFTNINSSGHHHSFNLSIYYLGQAKKISGKSSFHNLLK